MPTQAATTSLFTVNLLSPNSNAVRRQHASIIAQSMQAVGIDARLTLVSFAQLDARIFSDSVQQDFAHGGYDLAFIGWGATSPTPDSSFSNIRGDLADWSPNGNNYYLYNSSTVNSLINDMYSTPNFTRQQADLWNIESTLLSDAPFDIVYYTNWIIARAPAIKDYGSASVWSELAFPDVQHYSGVSTLNFAEAGNVFPDVGLNPLPTSNSNSFYALFIYSPAFGSLMEIDPRTNGYYLSMANGVNASADGLHWTINFKPTNFQDGVPVTADDFVFTMWANFDPGSGAVGTGSILSALGNVGNFKFLNGTTVTIDQSAGDTKVPFNVTAVDTYTFRYDLSQFYPFMNLTYTVISPLPKHFLEGFPDNTWSQLPYSTASGPDKFANGTTVTLVDPSNADGNNGKALVGPFGNGPYAMIKYDFTANIASLVKYYGYWNRTGLESLEQFSIKNYNVVWISGSDAAIAAYSQGTVNELDTNYGLAVNQAQLTSIGANVLTGPELGYQEMGVNNLNPVWGTGVNTPNGKTDPANAKTYAKYVREAFSHLIPRQLIVTNLLLNAGSPGVTPWSPAYGPWFNTNLQSDAYDVNLAKSLLAAAGYNTGVTPYNPSSGNIAVTPVTITVPNGTIGQISSGPVVLWGSYVPLSGTFASPVTGEGYGNMVLFLMTSTDNKTFTLSGSAITTPSGAYQYFFSPLAPGTVYYYWNFTGYTVKATTYGTTSTAGDLLTLISNGTLPLVLPPSVSPTYQLNFVALSDILNPIFANAATHNDTVALGASVQSGLNQLQTSLTAAINQVSQSVSTTVASQVSPLQTGLNQLTSQYSTLNSNLNTITYVAYGGIVIAIIALLVALLMSRRKPQ
ncbi:MAG TPA: ABC transporter substrate-binding protein [Conexivisphaerales archaeon]|nr:ABC transporter substrate-binding protein [Conexivisphaerales archaeon]